MTRIKPFVFAKCLVTFLTISCQPTVEAPQPSPSVFDLVNKPYELDTGLVSRSISFENTTRAPGESGKAASHLGVGRKGTPMRVVKPDSMFILCDITGPGTIRHIWMTTSRASENLRSIVVRVYWEGQKYPSIECLLEISWDSLTGKLCPIFPRFIPAGKMRA